MKNLEIKVACVVYDEVIKNLKTIFKGEGIIPENVFDQFVKVAVAKTEKDLTSNNQGEIKQITDTVISDLTKTYKVPVKKKVVREEVEHKLEKFEGRL